MNDETLVNPSHISVNSTYQVYSDDEVNQIRPKNKGEGTLNVFQLICFAFDGTLKYIFIKCENILFL